MPIINNRQTLLDIAVEHLGDAEQLVEVALLNGFDIDDLEAGTFVVTPTSDLGRNKIIQGLKKRNIVPASALDEETAIIDEWEAYYDNGEIDWDVFFGYKG